MNMCRFPRILCSGIALCFAVVIASSAWPQPPEKQKDLKAEFDELFDRMMRASEFAERDAAEWKLLKLGPAILPFITQPETAPSRQCLLKGSPCR